MKKKMQDVKQTESFSVVADDEKVAVIPSKAKKIRIENDNDHLFFRAHGEITNPEATLVVLEPNKVVIIKDGVSSGVLDSGSHELYNKKEVKKGFFSRSKSLKEEVLVDIVIYNPSLTYRGFWGTPNPIPYRDPETSIPVEFKGRGQFEIRIADVAKFHTTLVGSDPNFTMEKLQERIFAFILQEIRHEFARVLHDLHLGYIDITLHEKEIAEAIQAVISDKLCNEYGLVVPQFAIEQLFIDASKRAEIEEYLRNNRDEIKYKRDAKELAAEIERLQDKEWEREKYLIGLKREDYAKYLEVVKILGIHGAKVAPSEGQVKQGHFCSHCGAEVEADAAFCPKCGYQLKQVERVCPHCGKVVKSKGKFCTHCGKEL